MIGSGTSNIITQIARGIRGTAVSHVTQNSTMAQASSYPSGWRGLGLFPPGSRGGMASNTLLKIGAGGNKVAP
jgi:hypothetical protein